MAAPGYIHSLRQFNIEAHESNTDRTPQLGILRGSLRTNGFAWLAKNRAIKAK